MSDAVSPQLSRENGKTSESASYANVLLIGMKNTHSGQGTLWKGSTMDRDIVTWCNEWWRILLRARVTSGKSTSLHRELSQKRKRARHALNLLKPSVFSWLELLIKVMDRILFLCVQFFAAFNLFYSSNGFQWCWKNMAEQKKVNIWFFQHVFIFFSPRCMLRVWDETAPSLSTQPFYKPSVYTHSPDPVLMMIEYENVISQLSLPIFCKSAFTALLKRMLFYTLTRWERNERTASGGEAKTSFIMRKFIGKMFWHTSNRDGFLWSSKLDS